MEEGDKETTKESTKKIQEWVEDLGERSEKFELMCKIQEQNNEQLSETLGEARGEIELLQKEVKKLKLQNLKLKHKLLQFNWKQEANRANVESDKQGRIHMNTDNGMDPMEVFPEEVWRMIFVHLKDPKGLKSCYESCTKLQYLLQPQAHTFLFYDVLRIIAARYPEITRRSRRQKNSLLIKCRLVCQSWKLSIDKFLEEDTRSYPYLPVSRNSTRNSTGMSFRFTKNPWNDPALRNRSSDINPFARRYLTYNDVDSVNFSDQLENKRAYRNDFLEFLNKFGFHVWFFEVKFGDEIFELETFYWYSLLLTWLPLLPNLKLLYIRHPMNEWWKKEDEENTDYMYEEMSSSSSIISSDSGESWKLSIGGDEVFNMRRLQWLSEAIDENPFPTMKTLKVVAFEDCPPSLVEAVLESNPQIERIKIDREFENDIELDLSSITFKILREVSLSHRQYFCREIENVSWKLRKLTLDVPYAFSAPLFETLGKSFGNTLVDLDMTLRRPCHATERLCLPKLRKLNLKLIRCFNSIDFILPLLELRSLSVKLTEMYHNLNMWGEEDDEDYKPLVEIIETIKFHQFTHNLKRSNIWKLFPKLKRVRACTDRNEYGSEYYDGTTPIVNSKWQCCTRDQVNA